jgi:hypothetical protein
VGHAFVTAPQAQTIAGTGLTSGTSYYLHSYHEDPWYQQSPAVTSSTFTTSGAAPAPGPTVSAYASGGKFSASGSNLVVG